MAALRAFVGSINRRLAMRAALVVGAYLAAALVMLGIVIAVRARVSPDRLRDLLAYFVITNLAFGLDPGSAKAAALEPGGVSAYPTASLMLLSGAKALVLAPVLGVIWWLSEPQAPIGALFCLPGVCLAGFCVSNLRVMLDLGGRHAAATGLKQGVQSTGHLTTGLLLLAGLTLTSAIIAATVVQLVITAVVVSRMAPGTPGPVWTRARQILMKLRWLDFTGASAIAAASGSVDRVFGLRFLPAADYGVYYLSYEGLMRFWLIPYLLTPIVFARSVTGLANARLVRGAWALTLLGGGALIGGVVLALCVAPGLVATVLGGRAPLTMMVFAAGIVLLALVQIRLAELQAAGRARRALVVMGVNGLLATIIFYVAARWFGLAGMMAAWGVRGATELAIAMSGHRRLVRPGQDEPIAA